MLFCHPRSQDNTATVVHCQFGLRQRCRLKKLYRTDGPVVKVDTFGKNVFADFLIHTYGIYKCGKGFIGCVAILQLWKGVKGEPDFEER